MNKSSFWAVALAAAGSVFLSGVARAQVVPAPEPTPITPPASIRTPPSPPRAYRDRTGHLFVYAAEGHQLWQYEVGTDGTLLPLDPPTVPTTGDSPGATADPTGQFVFSMDRAHGNVFRYHTHPDGSLVSPPALALHIDGDPLSLTFDPTGRRAYVVDNNIFYRSPSGLVYPPSVSGKAVSRIFQFRFGTDGTLIPLSPPVAETEGALPRRLVFTPNGRFAYACESDGITQYAVRPDGTLRSQDPPEVGMGTDFEKLTMDPCGRFVYANVDNQSAGISRFRVEADGKLTALPALTISLGGEPTRGNQPNPNVALEPTGDFAYIASSNFESQTPSGPPQGIFQYRVSADGALTPLTPPRVPTVDYNGAIGFDPQGRFAYLESGSGIAQHQIRPDGTLAPLMPRVVKGGGTATLSVVLRTPAHFAFPLTAASDGPRRRQPRSPSKAFNSEEVIPFDAPQREYRFRYEETPLVFAPGGRFAYEAREPDSTVGRFGVGKDGALTRLPAAAVVGNAYSGGAGMLALDPAGQFAYITEGISLLGQFRVQADGILTPLTPPGLSLPLDVDRIFVHPNGRFLYNQGRDGNVSLLKIAPNGTLSPATPLSASSSQHIPPTWSLTLSPSGRAAYGETLTGQILQYAVGDDGRLTPLAPAAGQDPQPMSFSPDGRFAYVPDSLVGQIRQFRVGASGALTPLSPPTVPVGLLPLSVSVSPSGRFAYVVNGGRKAVMYRDYATEKLGYRLIGTQHPYIRQFQIGPDGALTQLDVDEPLRTDMTGAIVFGPTGRFAYQSEHGRQRTYQIGSNGSLSLVTKPKK